MTNLIAVTSCILTKRLHQLEILKYSCRKQEKRAQSWVLSLTRTWTTWLSPFEFRKQGITHKACPEFASLSSVFGMPWVRTSGGFDSWSLQSSSDAFAVGNLWIDKSPGSEKFIPCGWDTPAPRLLLALPSLPFETECVIFLDFWVPLMRPR